MSIPKFYPQQKRIAELIRESNGYFTYGDDNMGATVTWENKDLPRFVELIIKECGVALNPMLRDMISRGKAYDLIKDHFWG
jgi:hypothetical protein